MQNTTRAPSSAPPPAWIEVQMEERRLTPPSGGGGSTFNIASSAVIITSNKRNSTGPGLSTSQGLSTSPGNIHSNSSSPTSTTTIPLENSNQTPSSSSAVTSTGTPAETSSNHKWVFVAKRRTRTPPKTTPLVLLPHETASALNGGLKAPDQLSQSSASAFSGGYSGMNSFASVFSFNLGFYKEKKVCDNILSTVKELGLDMAKLKAFLAEQQQQLLQQQQPNAPLTLEQRYSILSFMHRSCVAHLMMEITAMSFMFNVVPSRRERRIS